MCYQLEEGNDEKWEGGLEYCLETKLYVRQLIACCT